MQYGRAFSRAARWGAVVLMAAVGLTLVYGVEPAQAASGYWDWTGTTNIAFTPAFGQAGTRVSASLSIEPPPNAPSTYSLLVTPARPEEVMSQDCAAGQSIPGLAPIALLPTLTADLRAAVVGHAVFSWPTGVAPGVYWLCAQPTTLGAFFPFWSTVPFVVLPEEAMSQAVVVFPSTVAAGSAITIAVLSGPIACARQAPTLSLLAQDQPAAAAQELFDATLVDPGALAPPYVYTVTLPASTPGGRYTIVYADGPTTATCAVRQQSALFTVLPGATVPLLPTPTSTLPVTPVAAVHPSVPARGASDLGGWWRARPGVIWFLGTVVLLVGGAVISWRAGRPRWWRLRGRHGRGSLPVRGREPSSRRARIPD